MNYWEKRTEEDLLNELKNSEKLFKKLKKHYLKAEKDIKKEISHLLTTFQSQTGFDRKKALEFLKGDEFLQWRMSMDEYLKAIEETSSSALKLELNTLAMRSRVTRYEAMESQIKGQLSILAKVEEMALTKSFSEMIERVHTKNMYYEFMGGNAEAIKFAKKHMIGLSPEDVERILKKNWKGSNYSKRIWKRHQKIGIKVLKAISDNLLTGKSLNKSVEELYKSIEKDIDPTLKSNYKSYCKRLILSETSFVKSSTDLERYKRLKIEKYRFIATLDSKTSEQCIEKDNEIYEVAKAVVGENFPPLHANCRSTTVAVTKYDSQNATRTARGEDGKTYKVPADMNYKQWKEKYTTTKSNSDEADFMGNRFNPKYGVEKELKHDITKYTTVNIRKVENSKFDMWAEVNDSKNMKFAVRNCEKHMLEIRETLPKGLEFPRIHIFSFSNHESLKGKLGGYNFSTNEMFFNADIIKNDSILKEIAKKNKGFFADDSIKAVFIHEMGHKYHYDLVTKLAKKQKISYNIAKEKFDTKIRDYIVNGKSHDEYYLAKKISSYANRNFDKGVNETMAEWFTIRNVKGNDLVDFINSVVREIDNVGME